MWNEWAVPIGGIVVAMIAGAFALAGQIVNLRAQQAERAELLNEDPLVDIDELLAQVVELKSDLDEERRRSMIQQGRIEELLEDRRYWRELANRRLQIIDHEAPPVPE